MIPITIGNSSFLLVFEHAIRVREVFMTIHTAREYQRMSPQEFDRWLNSDAIISSFFAIGILAMALAAIIVPYQSGNDVVAVVSTSMSGE